MRGTPQIYSQERTDDDAIAYVRIFDPCGSWTWYVMEWDGKDEAFGLVCGHCREFGYIPLRELAFIEGPLGIGLEIDVWFKPMALREIG